MFPVLRRQLQGITGVHPLAEGTGSDSLTIGPNKGKERPESFWCEPQTESLFIKGLFEEPKQKFQLVLELAL